MSIPESDRVELGGHDVDAAGVDDWRYLLGALHARFRTGDFSTGVRLVQAIGEAADAMDHHPDVDLRYPHVEVRLTSHDVGAVTQRDVRLARTVSSLAADLGAGAAPDEVMALEWALDTPDHRAVAPFWAALLGLADRGGDDLADRGGRWPTVWFQDAPGSEEGPAPAQRWHADVWVPADQAQARIAAVLEAGGTLVDDDEAPSFWVLADAQGNRACVCTWQDR